MKRIFLLTILLSLVTYGCAAKFLPPRPSDTNYHKNHTFAIYNNSNRLLTHPLIDMQNYENTLVCKKVNNQSEEKCKRNPPITDIYIIAHGWNYTLQEAIANFQKYIASLDNKYKELKELEGGDDFVPYYVYVTWPSATRPLTNLFSAVFPFGLDEEVAPATIAVDNTIFFLPTVWKQSVNAQKVGLGVRYPNDYLFEDWEKQPYGVALQGEEIGRDLPVSSLIYKLIKEKFPHGEDKKGLRDTSGKKFKIHLVGHSYGAKLVALAASEGIRQWLGRELIRDIEQDNAHQVDFQKVQSCRKSKQEEEPTLKILSLKCEGFLTGTSTSMRDKVRIDKDQFKDVIEYFNKRDSLFFSPIESLILFNPAFRPKELNYLVDEVNGRGFFICGEGVIGLLPEVGECLTTQLFKFIKRKALIFSSHDLANGWEFSMGQNLLNNAYVQTMDSFVQNQKTFPDRFGLLGGLALISEVVTGPIISMNEYVTNTFNWVTEVPTSIDWWSELPTSLWEKHPPIPFLDQPALGRTGLKRFSFTENPEDLGPLKSLFHTEQSEIKQEEYCRMASKARKKDEHLFSTLSPEWFYSFDASIVYNRGTIPDGAHNELNAVTEARCSDGDGLEQLIWKDLEEIFTKTAAPSNTHSPPGKRFVQLISEKIRQGDASFYAQAPLKLVRNDTGDPINPDEPNRKAPGSLILTNPPSGRTHDDEYDIKRFGLDISNAAYGEKAQAYNIHFTLPDSIVDLSLSETDMRKLGFPVSLLLKDHNILKINNYEIGKITALDTNDFPNSSSAQLASSASTKSQQAQIKRIKLSPITKPLEDHWHSIKKGHLWDEKLAHQERKNYSYWVDSVRLRNIVGDIAYLEAPETIELDTILPTSISDVERFVKDFKQKKSMNLKQKKNTDSKENKDTKWDFMMENLSPYTLQLIDNFSTAKPDKQKKLNELRKWLALDIERLVTDRHPQQLYEEPEFQKVSLTSPKTQKILKQKKEFWKTIKRWDIKELTKDQKVLLNRIILAEAFPKQIRITNNVYEDWKETGINRFGSHLIKAINNALKDEVYDENAGARKISKVCVIPKPVLKKKSEYTFNFVFNFTQNQCAAGGTCQPALFEAFKTSSPSELACYVSPPLPKPEMNVPVALDSRIGHDHS